MTTTRRMTRAVTPSDDSALRRLLTLAWPVVLARIGIMTMGLCDSIVVGRNSSTELAYLQLGLSPVGVVLVSLVGLLFGVQVMAARHVGEGQPARAGAVLRRGVGYAFGLGTISAAALHFGAPWVMGTLRLSPDLAAGGARVAAVLALSMVPHAVATACSFWLEGLARPIPGMIAMLGANLVNLVANLWLVPHYGGGRVRLCDLGVAPRAHAGARRLHPVVAACKDLRRPLTPARRRGGGARAAADRLWRRRLELRRDVRLRLDDALRRLARGIGVATWGIVLNVAAMIFMVPLGLAAATGVLVGQAYGARDRAAMVHAGRLGFGVCTIVTFVISVIVALIAPQIAAAYTRDPLLAAAIVPALMLATLFFVADGLQVVGAQALRARGDVVIPTATHTISYALFMLPLGYLLTFPLGYGIDGILWSVIAASIVAAAFLIARFVLLARRPLA